MERDCRCSPRFRMLLVAMRLFLKLITLLRPVYFRVL